MKERLIAFLLRILSLPSLVSVRSHSKLLFGQVLVKEGVLTPQQLREALELQRGRFDRIGAIVVDHGYATEREVLQAIERHYHISATALTDDLEDLIRRRPRTFREQLGRLRIPIKLKLAIAVTVIIWLTVLILSFVILARHREQLYQQIVQTGKVSLNYFVNNAGIPLLNDDILRLNTLIKEASSVEGLVYATIVDREQVIKADTDHARIGTTLEPPGNPQDVTRDHDTAYFASTLPSGHRVLDLSRPIRFKDKELGAVHVGVSLDFIKTLIHKESVFIIALSLFIVLLGISIAILIGIGFSRPISQLVLATEEIGKGNFHYRIETIRKDEFGDLALAFNFMAKELFKKLLIQKSFGTYVSQEVLDMILSNPGESWLKGVRSVVSILFTDVRNFTAYAETRKPEEIVEALNEYFGIATQCILQHGGYVNKFIGDAALAVFGVPLPQDDHAERAVRAAVALQQAFHGAGRDGNPLLSMVGIGINTGVVVSGNIGSQVKMEYTIIGDSVNVAARLNALAGPGEIIISSSVYEATKSMLSVEALSPQMIKGKSELVQTFRLLGLKKEGDTA
jgi:adenylate cyclase